MADRIFNLPQTRGSFEMAGKVTGTQRSNFYNEKETKSGAMRRVLSFGVQTSNENTFYVDLAGMPRDKVYFFRRADKDKGIEKDKKEVAWKDRLTYVAPEGYDMIGVKVGVTKKTNESGKVVNDNKTLTDFDAAKEISENLHDGDNVYVRGNIEYSTYNGKHQIRFVPTQVSLSSKEIDFDAEGFEECAQFVQTLVYTGCRKSEDDEVIIDAKIVNYSSIEDAEFFIDYKKDAMNKAMADSIRKRLKPYTSFECHGNIVSQQVVEDVNDAEDDLWGGNWNAKNKMKRQSTPVVRKLYIDVINRESFDPNPKDKDAEPTYTEDNISEARAKIAANTQAKKDFDGKAAGNDNTDWWGDTKKMNSDIAPANEEEDDWGV